MSEDAVHALSPLRHRPDDRTPPSSARHGSARPLAARSVEGTGLPNGFLVELLLKLMLGHVALDLRGLAERIALPVSVIAPLVDGLRRERLIEIGHGGLPEVDATYRLTESGRGAAHDASRRCSYAGPAPVPLDAYRETLAATAHVVSPCAATVGDALADVVADPRVLDVLGAAIASRRAILLHGPAGSGKTWLAERLVRLVDAPIPVPFSLYVAGEIVQVFDPALHQPIEEGPGVAADRATDAPDRRWRVCRRPVIVSGGELTLDMLELRFDPRTRIHQAPVHMKANGGLYVIDDLGRQRVPARDLLNRWIVPLDRRIDHLTLHTGHRFEVPFESIVVCSTNLDPERFADEAFLRRFGYKVRVGELDAARYGALLERACRDADVEFDPEAARWLIAERHARARRPLLAAWPRELVGRVRDLAAYERRPARLTVDALDRAWRLFFGDAPVDRAAPARIRLSVRGLAPHPLRRVR